MNSTTSNGSAPGGGNGTSPPSGPLPTAPGPKKPAFQGPCYLKMLVSNLVAGSIIGKSGAVIGSIEQSTGASMKLSPTSSFFPATNDRIVVMSGEQEQINRAMGVTLEKIGEVTAVQHSPEMGRCELTCKIVVPKSAVSGIIGKGGQQIKQLQEESGSKIQISNREQGMNERVVTITGVLDSIHNAAVQIATVIQEDPNLRDHMYVMYSPVHGAGAGGAGIYGTGALGFGGYGHQFGGGGGGYAYGPPFGPHQGGSPNTQPSANELEQLMMEHCEIVIEIADNSMGPVIGKGGIHLTEIMRNTGATIKLSQKGDFIPGTNNRKVSLSGTVSSVHRAHARLLLRLKETCFAAATRGTGGGANASGVQMTGSNAAAYAAAAGGGGHVAAGHVHAAGQGGGAAAAQGAYGQYGMHAQYQLPGYHQQYAQY